ncbi:L-ectoine synthase [Nesterenkonia sp. AN1]|uniref:L-ectoine synthase n=1 Tax=Nesterenkonia aurantiaca TaxID=1436010 RepID=A0A4R7G881_9MICC|nr:MULTISPECIES: ectoine synthase [Nesterenkonia]EXF24761.1 L-ectoine synthase [Nesterenkonia sp. AN1]TDS87738.1 ectoine synthase [Nesterenkonia aurantiaca]
MYTLNIDALNGTDRDIQQENWRSRRMVLAKEKVGFSLHETTLYAGTTNEFWYANHVEAVYCVGGKGTLTDLETGEKYTITDGFLYMLDGQEKHRVEVEEEIRVVCVFNPPVTGREVHDENGVYPLILEDENA